MEDSNKHNVEEIVRQVGYLPELYEDTLSEKYKILQCPVLINVLHIKVRKRKRQNCSCV